MTVSGEIGLQQSSLGSIGTVGIGQHNWAAAAQHGQHGHNCMLQAAILMRTQPMIFSTIACCRVLCPWGLSQQSSAHGAKLRGPQPKPLAHLPAAGCHAEGASAKTFGTLACCRVPCRGSLGQKSLAQLPATGCHVEGALAKNLWHTCLLQGAMPRGPWPKIFGTLACCRSPCQVGLSQKSLAHLPAAVHNPKVDLVKRWDEYQGHRNVLMPKYDCGNHDHGPAQLWQTCLQEIEPHRARVGHIQ